MEQYEQAYRKAMISAVKEADPGWKIGKPIKQGTLDGIIRESVEAGMKGKTQSVDLKV